MRNGRGGGLAQPFHVENAAASQQIGKLLQVNQRLLVFAALRSIAQPGKPFTGFKACDRPVAAAVYFYPEHFQPVDGQLRQALLRAREGQWAHRQCLQKGSALHTVSLRVRARGWRCP